MSNIPNLTDTQILSAVRLAEGFKGFPNGILDVWIRSDEDSYNKFDDKVYTFDCTGGEIKFVMVCTGTSNAGAEGLKHFDKYNREGCAILKSNIIVYDSHAYGLHKGKYPAYRQAKDFPYYRDGDKDNRAEEIGVIHHGIIGANCHKAGWFSTEIGGWSVACLVRNQQAQFDSWMRFMNRRPLTVCILQEKFAINPPLREVTPQNIGEQIDNLTVSAYFPADLPAADNPQGELTDSPQIPAVIESKIGTTKDENAPIQTAENIVNIEAEQLEGAAAVEQADEPFAQYLPRITKEKVLFGGGIIGTGLANIAGWWQNLSLVAQIVLGILLLAAVGGFIWLIVTHRKALNTLIREAMNLKADKSKNSPILTSEKPTDAEQTPHGLPKENLIKIGEPVIRPVFSISED